MSENHIDPDVAAAFGFSVEITPKDQGTTVYSPETHEPFDATEEEKEGLLEALKEQQEPEEDLKALVAQGIAEALGQVNLGAPATFEEKLKAVDPTDSDAALAMLDWLMQYKRLQRVGVLDGGQGYLFVYAEPKGSTKAGYVPGGTAGGRIVDDTLDKQRQTGPPKKQGLCSGCYSAVFEAPDGSVVEAVTGSTTCPNSTAGHKMT